MKLKTELISAVTTVYNIVDKNNSSVLSVARTEDEAIEQRIAIEAHQLLDAHPYDSIAETIARNARDIQSILNQILPPKRPDCNDNPDSWKAYCGRVGVMVDCFRGEPCEECGDKTAHFETRKK